MKRLKVFGVNYNGRERRIVAAYTQKEAAELFGVPIGHLRNYGCETGNAKEIALATSKPGTVFTTGRNVGDEYKEVVK